MGHCRATGTTTPSPWSSPETWSAESHTDSADPTRSSQVLPLPRDPNVAGADLAMAIVAMDTPRAMRCGTSPPSAHNYQTPAQAGFDIGHRPQPQHSPADEQLGPLCAR